MKFYLKLSKIVGFNGPLFLIYAWWYSLCQILEHTTLTLNTTNCKGRIFQTFNSNANVGEINLLFHLPCKKSCKMLGFYWSLLAYTILNTLKIYSTLLLFN